MKDRCLDCLTFEVYPMSRTTNFSFSLFSDTEFPALKVPRNAGNRRVFGQSGGVALGTRNFSPLGLKKAAFSGDSLP